MIRLTRSINKHILGNKFYYIILKKMQSEDNRRITKGTEHSIKIAPQKLDPDYVKKVNPEFLQERAKIWDTLYERQSEKLKSLPREKIIITLKDGKQIEGISFETTPIEIAKKNLKKSLVGDLLVAKVKFVNSDQVYKKSC
jgi:threonyl-tRNA synthetase